MSAKIPAEGYEGMGSLVLEAGPTKPMPRDRIKESSTMGNLCYKLWCEMEDLDTYH